MKAPQSSFFQKNLYSLVHLKRVFSGGFGKKYYSQGGEDIILDKIFSNKKNGFYVDVGAYHPKHYSNTYLLYQKGWQGINIDPNPTSIQLFKRYRRRDINLNSGVCAEVTKKPYFIFNHQSCNTFSVEQKTAILKKSYIHLIKEIDIPCAPLKMLLLDHTINSDIELLNIDVEGMNLEVLRSFDWNKKAPKVVCIEDDELDSMAPNFHSSIFSFLNGKSYILYAKTGLSSIYILKGESVSTQ